MNNMLAKCRRYLAVVSRWTVAPIVDVKDC